MSTIRLATAYGFDAVNHEADPQRWPPFCMVRDWVVAEIIVDESTADMHFG